jgi:maleate cis-trans isomerase
VGIVTSPGASYGWRATVGFILPGDSSAENSTYEFYMMAPPGVMMSHASLRVEGMKQEYFDAAIGRAEDAVKILLESEVDSIVAAGVPPIITHGWGFEAEVLAKVKSLTNVPTITDIGACIEAMYALDMKRVVMLTGFNPERYGDQMHNYLIDYVRHAEIEVLASDFVYTSPPTAVRRAPLAVPYRAAKKLYSSVGSADGIWITGGFMPSCGMIDALEQDTGVPVVSSKQALTWIGLRMAGIRDRVEGFGKLFEKDWPPRSRFFQG